jgi:hypothetical protein
MNDNSDMEELLKQHNPIIGDHVKKSVLDRYSAAYPVRKGVFWKKPVPLYKAAMAILITATISWYMGHSHTTQHPFSGITRGEPKTPVIPELKPVIAQNELL